MPTDAKTFIHEMLNRNGKIFTPDAGEAFIALRMKETGKRRRACRGCKAAMMTAIYKMEKDGFLKILDNQNYIIASAQQ